MSLIHFFVLSTLFLTSVQSFAGRNVCTITINSADEKQIFKSHLKGGDFNFIELTDFATSGRGSWMEAACHSGITCDVLIISGHFGGTFFGSNEKNLSLSSSEMERLSCNTSCDGIMKNPKEVFLFGCNTLASKEKDHRTPEQYRRVLLEDGIPAHEVERIVEARYGALGTSYKDQMRRIFPDTTIIHGFDSVGPSGKNVRPFLEKFFKNSGNYDRRLQKLEGKKVVNLIEKSNKALTDINAPMSNAMTGTAYTWCSGIGNDEKAARIKKNICGLFKNTVSGAAVALRDMLNSEDHSIYLMAINEFFKTYKGSNADVFKSLFSKDQKLKKQLTDLAKSLEKSSAGVAFDVYETMYHLGFASRSERESKYKSHVLGLLNSATRESIDLAISTIHTTRDIPTSLSFNDLGPQIKSSPFLGEVLVSLGIREPNATRAALNNIRNLNDENYIGNLLPISSLPGAIDDKTKSLERLNRINPSKLSSEKRALLGEIKKGFSLISEKDPRVAARNLSELKQHSHAVNIVNANSEELMNRGVYEHLFNNPSFTNKFATGESLGLVTLVNQNSLRSKSAPKVIDAVMQQKNMNHSVFNEVAAMTVRNDELTNYFINNLDSFDFRESSQLPSFAKYIKNTRLTESQKANLKRKIEASKYKDSYIYTFGNALD